MSNLATASGDSFYRIFRDQNNLAVFAYELSVARTPDGQQFCVIAKAATGDFAARFPNADGGKPTPTPTLSSPLESPLLSSGNKFVIPISSDPGLQQTLTDTVQIRLGQRGAATSSAGRRTMSMTAPPTHPSCCALSAGSSGCITMPAINPPGIGPIQIRRIRETNFSPQPRILCNGG